jgi:hypothetical protein
MGGQFLSLHRVAQVDVHQVRLGAFPQGPPPGPSFASGGHFPQDFVSQGGVAAGAARVEPLAEFLPG